MKTEYLIKYHDFYHNRVSELKTQVQKLKTQLSPLEYKQHEIVKFAARIRNAELNIIPEDPDKPEYKLKNDLKKFRRYKQGLQRYRIMFCFSSSPPIIIYLYLNNNKHLRKEGSKNDPYEEFKNLVSKGVFSHDPNNAKMKKWIRNINA